MYMCVLYMRIDLFSSSEEEEEECLFKDTVTQGTERRTPSANALIWCRRRVPPCYVPEGDSPLLEQSSVDLSRQTPD
jgi:hypothetical protein